MPSTESIFEQARQHLVGGVNSPVRAFKAVGGEPFFVHSAAGCFLLDTEGQRYLDYVMSWGAQILGHADEGLIETIAAQAKRGTSYGAATAQEVELAVLIKEAFPAIQKVRLVSSGTEAVMSAVRLARGFTGRKKILKFAGCYHGHSDSLLVKAGSGGATFGVPDSAGVPEELAKLTLTAPYNDLDAVREIFAKEGQDIACILVEPAAANMGLVLPCRGFLQGLREISRKYQTLLIFDEVITGFRLAYGGAQEFYGMEADLTCLGKILGGGMPLAAFGGRDEVMHHLAPEGKVYQAGTLSGNPIATACGIYMLKRLREEGVYPALEARAQALIRPLQNWIHSKGYPVQLNSLASLFTIFFTEKPVTDFAAAQTGDAKKYGEFFRRVLRDNIFLPPSAYEACFVSMAHGEEELAKTLRVFQKHLQVICEH